MYEEEVTQLQTKRRQEISEIDGRLTVQYEDKLQSALMELRDQYEAQLQTNRDEIINLYESKVIFYACTVYLTDHLVELEKVVEMNG